MLRNTIVYYSLFKMCWIIGHLPRKMMHCFGNFFGHLLYRFVAIRKKTSKENIRVAFPSLNNSDIENILTNMYRHFGKVLMDFFRLPFLSKKKLDMLIEMTPSAKTIINTRTNGIVLSAHFGNWELLPHILAISGLAVSAIARPQKDPGFDRFITWVRKSNGCKLISSRASTKEMMDELSQNFLVIVGDQRGSKRGIDINFFGKPARSPKGFCVFHIKTEIPIYFTTVVLGDNGTYILDMEEIIIEQNGTDINDRIRSINQKYHHMLEDIIKQHPQQYFWFHRKWL